MVRAFGNLMNRVLEESASARPVVGMGATICHFSDRSACTVISVSEGNGFRVIEVQGDHAKRIDNNGMSDSQTYEYTPNPKGGISRWRCRINAEGKQIERWRKLRPGKRQGTWKLDESGGGLNVGERDQYYDYSF